MSIHLSRKVSRKTMLTDAAVKEESKDTITETRSIHQLSRSYQRSRNFPDRSTQLSRICRDCDKKKLKSLTDSQVSRRCRDSLKLVFQEGKNIDMNAIKHVTQQKIQSTF